MLIIFHINHQNTNIQPNRRHTGEYYPQRLILHKSTSHNPDRMKKKPASARGRPKRLPTYRLRKDGTCGTSSDSHAGSLPKRPSDGPATLDLGGGIERHVCFAAAYDRHHPLPIQATPLPEKIPVHATKRNFRASIIENNRNRHDLWAVPAARTHDAGAGPEKYRGANFTIETGGFVGADKFRVRGFHPFSFTGDYTFDRHWFLGLGFSSAIYYPAAKTTDESPCRFSSGRDTLS